VFDRNLFYAMMKCQHHALFFVLAIGLSLWSSDCLAQNDYTLTTEGSCSAEYPDACKAEAAKDIETDVNVNMDEDEDEDEEDGEAEGSDCRDQNDKCAEWASIGECDANPGYMQGSCRRSCIQCPDQADQFDKILEERRKTMKRWTTEELEVAADMGTEQKLENLGFRVSKEQVAARIIAAREHIQTEEVDEKVKEICKNEHEDCTTW
jgi:hypothetical protein